MPTLLVCFFFNDTATTEIYTLSLHDALPIFTALHPALHQSSFADKADFTQAGFEPGIFTSVVTKPPSSSLILCFFPGQDRKSTRLNSSHSQISYAVFCLKKKNNTILTLSYPI